MAQLVRDNGTGHILYGHDAENRKWVLPEISNFHDHFRGVDDPRFAVAVKTAAERYRYVTAMPNLGKDHLINTPEKAIEYRERIHEEGRKTYSKFEVTVPLYVEPETTPALVYAGFKQGAWISMKVYSKGATTQSAEGIDFRKIRDLYPVFGLAEELGMIVLLHLEPMQRDDGTEIDPFDRESEGLFYLRDLLRTFPRLKIVFEHISSESGVAFFRHYFDDGYPIGATVAPQYLVWNRSRLFEGGMNPEYFSIPVLKRERDRLALREFLIDGYGFLGSDSAPHLKDAKAKMCGCAGGVFNDPVAFAVYFQVFKEEGEQRGIDDWFDRFVTFASGRGAAFYQPAWRPEGLEVGTVEIREEPWVVRQQYIEGENPLVPMLKGETIPYSLHRV